MKLKTMKYLDFDDIRKKFNKNIGDYSFTEMCENDSFVYLPTGETDIQESLEWAEDMAGTRYEQKHANTAELMRYLRDEMGIENGIHVYVSW